MSRIDLRRPEGRLARFLSDLPEHRRPGIARILVREPALAPRLLDGTSCFSVARIDLDRVAGARQGSDGRFHLTSGQDPICDEGRKSRRHRQGLHWWTDGRRISIQAPPGGDRSGHGARVVSWTVDLEGPLLDPAEIPDNLRCPLDRSFWPGHIGGTSPIARVREQLVRELGGRCAICQQAYPVVVDHDHESGLVRGYLCRWCNTAVEHCVHISGCAFGEYLDDPPAGSLGARHPHHRKRSRVTDDQVAQLLTQPTSVDLRREPPG